jgi:hypothetical protein
VCAEAWVWRRLFSRPTHLGIPISGHDPRCGRQFVGDMTLQAAALLLVVLPMATGCAVPLGQGDNTYTVGVVKTPTVRDCTQQDQPCYAVGRKSEHFGLRISDGIGIGIGYMAQNIVAVPLECRVVVLVQNQQQLEHAIRLYKTELSKGDLCTAIKPD